MKCRWQGASLRARRHVTLIRRAEDCPPYRVALPSSALTSTRVDAHCLLRKLTASLERP